MMIECTRNLSKVVDDCSEIDGKTVGDIMSMSTLPGEQKGHLFFASGCLDMNYNETITCAGFRVSSKRHLRGSNNNNITATNLDLSLTYTCYSDSSTKDFPLNRMWDYVHSVVESGPQYERLYSVQVLWEETATSIAIGEAHLSSLLDTEKRSQLNSLLTQKYTCFRVEYPILHATLQRVLSIRKRKRYFSEKNCSESYSCYS